MFKDEKHPRKGKKMEKLMMKAKFGLANKLAEKKSGFDGLIVTIGLILLVMILILVFRGTIVEQIKNSIGSVSDQINGIATW